VPGGAGCTHGAHSPVGAQTVREPDRWLGGNALRADHKIAHQAPTSGAADLPFIEHGARIKRAAACSKTVSSGMPHRQFLSRNARPHTIRLTHGRPDPVVLASTRRKKARRSGPCCGGRLNIAPGISIGVRLGIAWLDEHPAAEQFRKLIGLLQSSFWRGLLGLNSTQA
jgi:hypothetical protein